MARLPSLEARNTLASSSGSTDTQVIAVYQDSSKKALPPKGGSRALVERFRKNEAFTGRHNSTQYVRFTGKNPVENSLLVGLGETSDLTEEKARLAGGSTWIKLVAERSKGAVVLVDSFYDARGLRPGLSPLQVLRAFAEGLILPAYQFKKYKTSEKDSYGGPARIVFQTKDKTLTQELKQEIARVDAIGEAVQVTRDWSNEPSNFGTPEYFALEAKKWAKQLGLKIRILTEAEAKREKMGLFLGVAQGAEREARMVVLEYHPKSAAKAKTIALVGKGVTFDSGGISIKPALRMEEMKHDMTGAATVMGAMILAARWKVPNRIVGVMAFTENMPDGNAIQPGNILTARSGKTVEIINTDAEGRLILADALDLAQDYKPDALIDIATLTGAVSIALGKLCSAVLGNDESLIEAVKLAGSVNGERIWQLPLFDEYFEDLKSDYADIKNTANDSYGGTIRGAMFLKQFIRKGTQWAHLDIASSSYNLAHLSYYPKKGASGAYVRTLAQFTADF